MLDLVERAARLGDWQQGLMLLDKFWRLASTDERAWFLRLWLLTGQRRFDEALDLSHTALSRFPASTAILLLYAGLAHSAGHHEAAMEAALRAAAIAPDRTEPTYLIGCLLDPKDPEPGGTTAAAGETWVSPVPPGSPTLTPLAAALHASRLLSPPTTVGPFRPVLGALDGRKEERPVPPARWKGRSMLAFITAGCAVWAIRDPLPAAAVLAVVLLWAGRHRSRF
jgi:tetratricopeptide (TPR) repeat protein